MPLSGSEKFRKTDRPNSVYGHRTGITRFHRVIYRVYRYRVRAPNKALIRNEDNDRGTTFDVD